MAPEVIKAGEEERKYKRKLKSWKRSRGQKKPEAPKPELVGYGLECDIWSAGVLLYAMVHGVLPFRGITVREIKEKIANTKKDLVVYKEEISNEC